VASCRKLAEEMSSDFSSLGYFRRAAQRKPRATQKVDRLRSPIVTVPDHKVIARDMMTGWLLVGVRNGIAKQDLIKRLRG